MPGSPRQVACRQSSHDVTLFLFCFSEAPPRSGASPFQKIAAVRRCLRQRVIKSILRHANPVRSRRLATVDTDESVGSNVGLSMRKASEVWFVYHHQCNFCGGSRGSKKWSFVENRAALKSGTFLVHNCRCSCLDRQRVRPRERALCVLALCVASPNHSGAVSTMCQRRGFDLYRTGDQTPAIPG